MGAWQGHIIHVWWWNSVLHPQYPEFLESRTIHLKSFSKGFFSIPMKALQISISSLRHNSYILFPRNFLQITPKPKGIKNNVHISISFKEPFPSPFDHNSIWSRDYVIMSGNLLLCQWLIIKGTIELFRTWILYHFATKDASNHQIERWVTRNSIIHLFEFILYKYCMNWATFWVFSLLFFLIKILWIYLSKKIYMEGQRRFILLTHMQT